MNPATTELAVVGAGSGVDGCRFAVGWGPGRELAVVGAGSGVDGCRFEVGTDVGLAE